MEQWRADLEQYRRRKAEADSSWADYLRQRTVVGYSPLVRLHDAGLTESDRSLLRWIRIAADG